MIEVSDDFKKVWADLQGRVVDIRLTIKKRYYNGVNYVLEAGETIIPSSEIIKISPINWKLDAGKQNQILASNLSVRLKNEKFKWVETNIADGLFRPTEAVPVGFDPVGSEFRLYYGLKLDDDTYEYVNIFTGEALTYLFDTTSMGVDISIRGRESKLQLADAQNVSTTFTNEPTIPATGDNTNKDFKAKVSVWEVTNVRVATADIEQGARYKLSNVNDAELETLITIDPAPTAGQAVDWSGRQWKRGYRVSELVAFLLAEAGITDYDLEEPLYPDAASFQEIDSAVDFAAGVRVNVEKVSEPGKISRQWYLVDDFDDGNFTANPSWNFYGGTTPVVTGGRLVVGGNGTNGNIMGLPHSNGNFGSWEFVIKHYSGAPFFMMVLPFMPNSGVGYGFYINPDTGGPSANLIGLVDNNRNSVGVGAQYFSNDVDHIVRITSDTDGNLKLYLDGVLISTATLTLPTVAKLDIWNSNPSALDGNSIEIDKIHYSNSVEPSEAVSDATAQFTSAAINLGSTPSAWGKITNVVALNGGTVSYETATSNDGMSFDPFVAVATDGMILSTLRQYIKVRVTITPAAGAFISPVIDVITVNYYVTDLFVGHADFKSKTCFQAIQRLAEITDMEFGFDGAGRFFFRNKNVSPEPILDLDQSNSIVNISSFNAGYDRVLNVAQITYNEYYSEKSSITEAEAAPTSIQRFGRKISTQTIDDFLFSNNANYAESIAKLLYRNNYRPRRTGRLETRIIPHLELSDVIRVSYFDSPGVKETVFGDQLGYEPTFGKNTNVLLREMPAKVIGISSDVGTGKSTIEFQEVLS